MLLKILSIHCHLRQITIHFRKMKGREQVQSLRKMKQISDDNAFHPSIAATHVSSTKQQIDVCWNSSQAVRFF